MYVGLVFVDDRCRLTPASTSQLLPCMSLDGCKVSGSQSFFVNARCLLCSIIDQAFFPESEAVKFLPSTTLAALHKIRAEKEVDFAELEGLAKCPCVLALL